VEGAGKCVNNPVMNIALARDGRSVAKIVGDEPHGGHHLAAQGAFAGSRRQAGKMRSGLSICAEHAQIICARDPEKIVIDLSCLDRADPPRRIAILQQPGPGQRSEAVQRPDQARIPEFAPEHRAALSLEAEPHTRRRSSNVAAPRAPLLSA